MKTKSKALAISLCAILLVIASVMGTMAYLTSTDEVTNTFTVGKVAITLDEAKVNNDGKPVDEDGNVVEVLSEAERVEKNSYKLMPGHEYTKDPTVTVKAVSEESYVRLKVTVTFDKILADETLATELDDIFVGYNKDSWPRVSRKVDTATEEGKSYTVLTYEYRYTETVSAPETDKKLAPLFTSIKIPGEWTNDKLSAIGGFNINIVAEAIQADGFVDDAGNPSADKAWAAFENQNN